MLVKQDALCGVFLAKLSITVPKSIFCNVRLNTETSQVVQAILIYGGPEIICDEHQLDEASFC